MAAVMVQKKVLWMAALTARKMLELMAVAKAIKTVL